MTAPRAIHPGQTYLITRRCTQRQFLLRPDETTERIFEYCLAEAAQRFGMRLIAWIALSNHYHLVLEDTFGLLPAFLAHLNKMLAKVLNARWRRAENLWASEQASAVWLVEATDVFDKAVYTLANPVAAELVDRLVDWPSASSLRWLDGREVEVARPRVFFRDDGDMPSTVLLRAHAPTGWVGGMDAWAESVRAAVEARESAVRRERLTSGRRIVGRRSVLRASPFGRPAAAVRRGGLRPTIACRNPGRREEELRALREFRNSYAAAREAACADARATVIFPAGTYKLAREGLVRAWPARPVRTFDSWVPPP